MQTPLTSFTPSYQTSVTDLMPSSSRARHQVIRVALAAAASLAVTWLIILSLQPVHIPHGDFSKWHLPQFSQALSGVKGQVVTVPSDRLSRIDIWMRTLVPTGEMIQVKYDLIEGLDHQNVVASGLVTFNRSGREWQSRVVFSPHLLSKGELIYLRMESVLSSPRASIHYAFLGRDLYPHGAMLDLDRVEVPDQDMRFRLYTEPVLPKPFAWLEAVLAPTVAAADKASGPPPWIVASTTGLIATLITALIVLSSVLGSRVFPPRLRREAAAALLLSEVATAVAIVAGSEAPIAKLWVHLS